MNRNSSGSGHEAGNQDSVLAGLVSEDLSKKQEKSAEFVEGMFVRTSAENGGIECVVLKNEGGKLLLAELEKNQKGEHDLIRINAKDVTAI